MSARTLGILTFDTGHENQVDRSIIHEGCMWGLEAQGNLGGLAAVSSIVQKSGAGLEGAGLKAGGPQGGTESLLEDTLHDYYTGERINQKRWVWGCARSKHA
jgi:hypothetical protein